MKKAIIVFLGMIAFASVKAQIQNSIFVGLNSNPLVVTGGVEFAVAAKKNVSVFLRPTFNRKIITNKDQLVSYIDVPVGFKFLIDNNPNSGVGFTIDFNAGAYIGYAIKGKYLDAIGGGRYEIKPMKFGSGTNAQFAATDYGYFFNTQLSLGGVFGFGLSLQGGLAKHDRSKLGYYATSEKKVNGSLLQVTVFFNISNIRKISKNN